tara:strand:- start:1696 stop:2004 length:309 start_codon:yes stop_codon:yes gene_type:complete
MAAKKKAIAVPVKLERWFRDIESVTTLRDLVEQPAFQQAVAILKEAAGPSVHNFSDDPQANSHRFAWYAGYRDAFNDLEKLTRQPNSPQPQQINEWNHIQNP